MPRTSAKTVLFTLLLWFSYTASANPLDPLLKEPGTLNVCSYDAFTPISYGNGQGYEADLLRAIAKSWGVKVKFFSESIYEGIWRYPSRVYTKCDVAIGGFTPMAYRLKEGVGFSIGTTSFRQSLLVRQKDYAAGRVTSYASFKNTSMKIGVVPGSSGEIFARIIAAENKLPANVFVPYLSEAELLPALKSGKIDAIARGEIGNEFQSAKHPEFVTIAKRDFGEKFTFALDKSNVNLIKAFNLAILKITDHHKIQYSQWLLDHDVFMKNLNRSR